jgi:hypothetical protein
MPKHWIFILDEFRIYEINKELSKLIDSELKNLSEQGPDANYVKKEWMEMLFKHIKEEEKEKIPLFLNPEDAKKPEDFQFKAKVMHLNY